MPVRWLVDGTNVMGSRPDGWWNDRPAAASRLAQRIAEWCRAHDDDVVVVFDRPAGADAVQLGGGNLVVLEARRGGRNAADDDLVDLAVETITAGDAATVVSSDRGLIARLPSAAATMGAGRFLAMLDASRPARS